MSQSEATDRRAHDQAESLFYFTFLDVWWFCIFWVALWFGGKTSEAISLPSLVGEIMVGIMLGPKVCVCVCSRDGFTFVLTVV